MKFIRDVDTLTSKEQITLPKPTRQALGVGAIDKHISTLPRELAKAMALSIKASSKAGDEDIRGDVQL